MIESIKENLVMIGAAAGLALYALGDNVVFFHSPNELAAKNPAMGAHRRIGGLVATGSVVRSGEDQFEFTITEGSEQVRVSYVWDRRRTCSAKARV